VTVLEPDDAGMFERKAEKEIVAAKDASAAVVALAGNSMILALGDGRVLILDVATLELRNEFRPAGETAPRFAAAAPGGGWFLVLFHNRTLWLYDIRQARHANFWLTGQGNISAAVFSGPNHLLAADRGRRITSYLLEPFRAEESRAEELGTLERAYYYGLVPLHTVFPRPGELGNAFQYLLQDKDEEDSDWRPKDLSRHHEQVDVAGPIWSSLGFLAVMLMLSCFYVWRTDF